MNEELMNNELQNETKLDSVGSMFTNIFFEPIKVFKRINIKPSWLIPFLVFLLCVEVMTVVTSPVMMQTIKDNIEASADMTPEEKEQALTMITTQEDWAFIGFIAAPIFVTIFFFISAGILLLMGNIILGGDASFSRILSINAWTALIGGLGALVKTGLIMMKNSADVRLSLAIILPGSDSSSWLFHFLNTFTDLFLIWQTFVMILGAAIIFKFSKGKAAVAVLVPTVLLMGIAMLFAKMGSV